MNKIVLSKDNRIEWQIISEVEINLTPYLETYKDCEIKEERYIDDILIDTIIHTL